AEILIEMESDFAVGAGPQSVARLLALALDGLKAVEFAIDDDAGFPIVADDGLVPGCQIDDAETGVAEGNASVGGNPVALPVGTAMFQTAGRPVQHGIGDWAAMR